MVTRARDGTTWRIGTDAEIAWIANGTSTGRTITAAIPPVFEAYATVVLPYGGKGQDQHDQAVLALLSEQSADQPWWLGYLDTGADRLPRCTEGDLVLRVALRAGRGRPGAGRHLAPVRRLVVLEGALPNLMFPAGRSWLVSTLWDDDWTGIGAPAELVDRFVRHPGLQARRVVLGQDATPSGHQVH